MADIDVQAVIRMAVDAGFRFSCQPAVGQLLATLAAAVPPGGSILELGTGAGVGLAWLVTGLGERTDVEVVSVEADPDTAQLAARHPWPGNVRLVVGDALDVLGRDRRYQLVFADAQGGKWEGLDDTVNALAPGGFLVVDDMAPAAFVDDLHRTKTAEVRDRLLADVRLTAVEVDWAGGVILCTRAHPG